ncbi:uncharacterized protein LOC123386477 isoform X1 [Felis catus]|uniref:uncharacterized protein LOC123386477 isoform X1 n=1 Tax=Felis catus TaxID=9685 RepID=UPI001D19D226|nr:uncharacterized protein LOC123386477 isoform X1 [Felis catus]
MMPGSPGKQILHESVFKGGYYGYVAILKMRRSSSLHSTNIHYVLLRGMNWAWDSRSGGDWPGFSLQESVSVETKSDVRTTERKRKFRRAQMEAEGTCTFPRGTKVNLKVQRMDASNAKCAVGVLESIPDTGRTEGPPSRDQRSAQSTEVPAEQVSSIWPLLCPPRAHPGTQLPHTQQHPPLHTEVANACQANSYEYINLSPG